MGGTYFYLGLGGTYFSCGGHLFLNLKIRIFFAAYGGVLPLETTLVDTQNPRFFAAYGGVLPLEITLVDSQNPYFFAAYGGILALEIRIFDPRINIFRRIRRRFALEIMFYDHQNRIFSPPTAVFCP